MYDRLDEESEERTYRKTPCKRCQQAMTWEAQRRQFGRLVRKGVPVEQIKGLMPLCQKCVMETWRQRS